MQDFGAALDEAKADLRIIVLTMTKEHAMTHRSVALLVVARLVAGISTRSHLYGRSFTPGSGGTGEAGYTGWPGLVFLM